MSLGTNETVADLSSQELLKRGFNEEGFLEVHVADQTSPTVIIPVHKVDNTTTLSQAAAIGDKTIVVTATTGFDAGDLIWVVSPTDARFYHGIQIGAISGNTVTLDTPLDFAFPTGSVVTNGTEDMAVNGAVTPVTFSLRAAEPAEGVDVILDVTRIIITCTCPGAVDLSKFGSLAALTNGLVIRKRDGVYRNILNAKTNLDLLSVAGNFTVYAASNPAQGIDGFSCVLTFAGKENLGVAVRVGTNERLDFIVQDDLSSLTHLHAYVEGHVVVP